MARYSIRQRESGRYQARWYTDAGERRTKMFQNRSDAKRFLDRVSADRQRGDYIDPRDGLRTVREVADLWLEAKHLRPKTRAAYESILRLRVYPAFQDRPINRITALDVQAWITRLSQSGLAAGTVHNAYRVLSGVLDAAVRANYTRANVARALTRNDLPKPVAKEMLFLTADEVNRLADQLPAPWALMTRFAAVTGMRAGEINGLRWENVDLLRGRVRVAESVSRLGPSEVHINPPKNGKVRTVPITAEVAAALREYASVHPDFGPGSYVWPSPVDSPTEPMHWGRDFYLKEWKAAVARAGLPRGLRFHDLRHTCASLLIAAKIPAKAIQAHLGHSSFAITMDRYGHLYSNAADDVAAALGRALG